MPCPTRGAPKLEQIPYQLPVYSPGGLQLIGALAEFIPCASQHANRKQIKLQLKSFIRTFIVLIVGSVVAMLIWSVKWNVA